MALARTQYVRSGDADIAYQVIGDGPRDIVVVLDWASHLEALVEQPFLADWFTSLARFGRVLWLGTRGVGMSGPWMKTARSRAGCTILSRSWTPPASSAQAWSRTAWGRRRPS